MKKYFYSIVILLFTLVGGTSIFSQSKITTEQLVGSWEIVKFNGKDEEKDILGSVFHFKPSGVLIADKPKSETVQKDSQKKGIWKVIDNNIVLYKEDEDPQKDKGTTLTVTRFEGNMLFLHDEKEKVSVVFERIKN